MTIQNPIGGKPEDPYEKYRVARLDADKRAKEEKEKKEEMKPTSSAFIAFFLYVLHRFLDLFEDVSGKALSSRDERDVRDNLLQIKILLEAMKQGDRSQDAPFLNRFSKLWHQALEDTLRFRKETPLADQFKEFIKDIDSYPGDQEYSLGYYLSEHARQKWLPFPYMDLILKIHNDHKKDPDSSALARWIREVDTLLNKMKEKSI